MDTNRDQLAARLAVPPHDDKRRRAHYLLKSFPLRSRRNCALHSGPLSERPANPRQMPDSMGPETGSAEPGTSVIADARGWCREAQPSTNAPHTTRIRPTPML